MKEKKILKTRRYKAGYIVQEELIDGSEYGGKDIIMKSAYTHSGDYIGDPKTAYRLCKKMGIQPQKRSPDHNVCSIGFCSTEQKYYGWSHRAIYGFGIGSEVKRGDCGYQTTDPQDMLADIIRFWVDEDTIFTRAEIDVPDPHNVESDRLGALLETRSVKKNGLGWIHWEPYPEVWGRGEWRAETLEDAKQMAIDFAEGVS